MNTQLVSNPDILGTRCKNVVVSGKENSGKTDLAHELADTLKENNENVLFCEFDREKYVLYGKDVNLTSDVILKNALFSCSNTKSVAQLEEKLCENTTLIIDNYDVSCPSPYMRHLFTLPCRVVIFTRCDMKKLSQDAVQIMLPDKEGLCVPMLDQKQNELLLSLCCMLYYLEPSTKIVSSRNGVFDIDSAKLYLGNLSDNLDFLVSKGLVKIQNNGKITIPRKVMDYVVKVIKPTPHSLPTLEKYLQRVEYRSVNHELFDIITYLALNDENHLCDVLKMLLFDAINGKKNRIFNRNISYLANKLTSQRFYENSELYNCCKQFLKLNRVSPFALSLLCKLKICSYNLVGKSSDMYKANTFLLELILDSLKCILSLDKGDREYVARLAIDYCKGLFFYHGSVFPDGTFKAFRENTLHHEIIVYTNEYFAKDYGNSLFFAHSPLTVELYLTFQRLLSLFPQEYEKQIEEISIHFWRMAKGYNCFYDFFDKKYVKRISERDREKLTEKMLCDDKRFIVRGFDSGTKTGAVKYASMIMEAVKNSSNPMQLALLVLNPCFPLCDETYKSLIELGFVRLLKNSKYISNLSRQELLETLVLNYNKRKLALHLVELYDSLIDMLRACTSTTNTFLAAMSETVCRMYVTNALNDEYCNSLFEAYYIKKLKNRTAEDILAKMIYNYITKGVKPKDGERCDRVISCVKKQYRMAKPDFDERGFDKMRRTLL